MEMCPFRAGYKTPATRGNNTEVVKILQKSHNYARSIARAHLRALFVFVREGYSYACGEPFFLTVE